MERWRKERGTGEREKVIEKSDEKFRKVNGERKDEYERTGREKESEE